MEVSAKISSNIDEIFQKLLQQILKAEEANKNKKEEEPVVEQQTPAPQPTAPQPAAGKSKGHKKNDCNVQ